MASNKLLQITLFHILPGDQQQWLLAMSETHTLVLSAVEVVMVSLGTLTFIKPAMPVLGTGRFA